ncbi:nuclear apoptosis-inducing factor 1-like [Xyrichtys novacula]|uniref:Nuclear apoptosis-inducing factor 1-like n=1 Tax=Xyrichtys novacula TaxID=13765 RepID=A0AAV1EXL4_XYRNO|nr:nuclear apoptosis-inducing factor 1-like [Xyrichtys novacula]
MWQEMMCIVSSVTLQLEAVGEEVEEEEVLPSTSGTLAAGPSVPSTPSESRVRRGGQVLTDTVLQTQRDTIGAIREVREELAQIRIVLQNMCDIMSAATDAIKELLKK